MCSLDKTLLAFALLHFVLQGRTCLLLQAFEGHRLFDLIRNKKNVDRKFTGAHPWEVVKYDDNRFQNPIPNNEWTVSDIQQNPGYGSLTN